MFITKTRVIFLWLFVLILTACSSGNCSSSTLPTLYTLGTLPNNSIIWASSASFETPNNNYTSGVIGINGGTPGNNYMLSFSVSPIGPDVVCSKTPCILTSGGNDTVSINFNGNNQPAGIYTVTVYYTELTPNLVKSSLGAPLPNTIQLTLTQGSSSIPGNLFIAPLEITSLEVGESLVTTISLSNSSNITTPVVTTITPQNANISITPATCNLTTENNSCQVTLDAISTGISGFSVSANNYTMVSSESILINSPAQFMITSSQTGELNNYQTQSESLTNLLTPNAQLNEIAQKDNTIVTTGFYGAMFNSHDNGNTWEMVKQNSSTTFTGIVANTTHFFAIGDKGIIIRSSDGDTWQSIANISSDTYPRSIGINNNTVVVVGLSGLTLVSQDNGNTWENKSLESITTELRSITHSGNDWVAVGGVSSLGNNQATIVVSHDNGISWHNHSQINSELQSVATIGNGIFTAVGSNGLILVSTDNGDTWSTKSGALIGTLTSVKGNGTTFVTAGANPGQIGVSTDSGNTWTRNTTITFTSTANNVQYAENKWIIAANNGQIAMSTDNGATWSFIANSNINTIAYLNTLITNNQIIAVGSDGTIMYTNNSGGSWSNKSLNQVTTAISGIASHDHQFVAVGNGAIVVSNNNGNSWARATSSINPVSQAINNHESIFVAVGNSGQIMRSNNNGQSFESIQSPVTPHLTLIVNHGSNFVAAGRSGSIIVSSDDGLTWESRPISGATGHFSRLLNHESTFVAVGASSTIVVSHNNGNTWEKKTVPDLGNVSLSGLSYSNNTWIISGSSGTILKSIDDGNTWVKIDTGLSDTLGVLSASADTFITISGLKIFISHDNGDTWIERTAPLTSGTLRYIASKNQYFLASGENSNMIISNDYGETWQQLLPFSGSALSYIYPY